MAMLQALLDTDEPVSSRDFVLTMNRVTLGRGADNDLVLPSFEVSRLHAVIEYDGQHYLLSDLDSSNGTFLNGRSVARRTALRDCDVIAIGSCRIRFVADTRSST